MELCSINVSQSNRTLCGILEQSGTSHLWQGGSIRPASPVTVRSARSRSDGEGEAEWFVVSDLGISRISLDNHLGVPQNGAYMRTPQINGFTCVGEIHHSALDLKVTIFSATNPGRCDRVAYPVWRHEGHFGRFVTPGPQKAQQVKLTTNGMA